MHVHSVAIVALRRVKGVAEAQLHPKSPLPAHKKMRAMNLGVCWGRMDKNKSPIEVAQEVLLEEGDIDCPIDRIYDCGKIFASTQSSEHVFLFVADVTDLTVQELRLEQEELEYGHAK